MKGIKAMSPEHKKAASKPSDTDFRAVLRSIAHTRSSIVSVFSDFCRIVACSLAVGTREDEYFDAIKGYSKSDLNQFAKALGLLVHEMESRPFEDVLGMFYTEIHSAVTRNDRGEFYTPPAISSLMARLAFDPEKIKTDQTPFSISDPCCGSGGIILSCAEAIAPHVYLMRATLQDISPVACDMAYINTTLWGIPAEIILGDTLKLECLDRWTNIHWHRVGEEQRRKSLKILDAIRDLTQPHAAPTEDVEPQNKPPPAGPHIQLKLF
jgi:hypothetical protein|tara:strand:- start:1 stop:801 length:801 start_codon:yes stop_codon:yes gene_type:complete